MTNSKLTHLRKGTILRVKALDGLYHPEVFVLLSDIPNISNDLSQLKHSFVNVYNVSIGAKYELGFYNNIDYIDKYWDIVFRA